jgi:hypothetical protein
LYRCTKAGSESKCNPNACSSKFFSCPDVGSHNSKGSVVAHYSGPPPPPPAPLNAATVGLHANL